MVAITVFWLIPKICIMKQSAGSELVSLSQSNDRILHNVTDDLHQVRAQGKGQFSLLRPSLSSQQHLTVLNTPPCYIFLSRLWDVTFSWFPYYLGGHSFSASFGRPSSFLRLLQVAHPRGPILTPFSSYQHLFLRV